MRIEFRQGIVSHSKDLFNNQNFLSVVGLGVQLSAVNKPLTVTTAHRYTNYLHIETRDTLAWPNPTGGFLAGTTYYLFIELDVLTAQRTFGLTTRKPIFSFSGPPLSEPPISQLPPGFSDFPVLQPERHWFDITNFRHYVYNGTSWREIIRIFVGSMFNSQFTSESINAPLFTGTQIGILTANHSGRILFDESARALRRPDGTFLTTEDDLFTNAARVDAIRLESNVAVIQNADSAAVAEFQVVAVQSFPGINGKFKTAQYEDTGATVLGILTQDTLVNDYGGVIIQGVVTNPVWNWPTAGVPLWVDNGALVEIDPHVANNILHPIGVPPTARVLSRDTVVFEQGLGGKGEQGVPGAGTFIPPASTSTLGAVTLCFAPLNPLLPAVVGCNDPRLTDARAPLAHTHPATDITFTPCGGVISTNVQAAICEVDSEKVNRSGDTMTGFLTLNANPINQFHAATKQYVDNIAAGIKARPAANVRTTADLSVISGQAVTYNNGTLGVGATLTNFPSLGVLPPIDGVVLVANNRILVAEQVSSFQNGVYVVTSVGSVFSSWVLTRCDTCDESNEIPSSYVFVHQGTIYTRTAWVAAVANPSTFVVGSGAITWILFSAGDDIPGGPNTSVQFNDGGAFGGDADLTWNKTTNLLSVNGDIEITSSELRFQETGPGIEYVGFKAPVSITTNRIWTLPAADGTIGQALVTDGAGNLSFMTFGTQSAIQWQDESINLGTSGTVNTLNFIGTGVTATRLGNTVSVSIVGVVPGGADTYIQFNDGGVFGGDSDFTWNKTSNVLDVSGSAHFTGKVGINNAIPTGSVTLEITGDFQINSEIRFKETGPGSEYVGFKAPVSVTVNRIWTLPAADGTVGQAIVTDGAGNLSFATAGAQSAIQWQDESTNLGASGTVNTVDFVGSGVTATRLGNTVSVSVSGTSPGAPFASIQFNDGGVFGGDADLTWNNTTNILTLNGAISNAFGTAALPSYTFITDADTGMYHSAANEVSIAIGGLQKIKFDSTGVTVLSGFFSPGAATPTTPEYTFTNDLDTGIFRSAANTLGIAAGGIAIISVATTAVSLEPFGASLGNTTELRFKELAANGTNYVAFKAPDSITTNKVWTLPTADGTSGQALVTDGAGGLSFATVSISQIPYDIAFFAGLASTASVIIASFASPKTINFIAGLTSSLAICDTPPTANVTYDIVKKVSPYTSSTILGTVTFLAGNRVGSFTFGSPQTISPTNLLQLKTQATVDTTIRDISITIVGCTTNITCP